MYGDKSSYCRLGLGIFCNLERHPPPHFELLCFLFWNDNKWVKNNFISRQCCFNKIHHNKWYDLLWPVSDEPSHFRDEVGKHGQSAHHVEHYEHFANVGLRVDVTVANLKMKEVWHFALIIKTKLLDNIKQNKTSKTKQLKIVTILSIVLEAITVKK